jgi:hypothetical protein
VPLVIRTHSEREATRLRGSGDGIQPIHAELELAVQMSRYTLRRFGVSTAEVEAIAQGLRDRGGRRAPTVDLRPTRRPTRTAHRDPDMKNGRHRWVTPVLGRSVVVAG